LLRRETLEQAARVGLLPRLAGGRVSVELDERVDEVTPHGLRAEELGQLRCCVRLGTGRFVTARRPSTLPSPVPPRRAVVCARAQPTARRRPRAPPPPASTPARDG